MKLCGICVDVIKSCTLLHTSLKKEHCSSFLLYTNRSQSCCPRPLSYRAFKFSSDELTGSATFELCTSHLVLDSENWHFVKVFHVFITADFLNYFQTLSYFRNYGTFRKPSGPLTSSILCGAAWIQNGINRHKAFHG